MTHQTISRLLHSGYWFSIVVICSFCPRNSLATQNTIEHNNSQYLNTNGTYISTAETILMGISSTFETVHNVVDKVLDVIPSIISRKSRKLAPTEQKSKGMLNVLDSITEQFRAIYPGTKWCGDGNITTSEEELGFFKTTDACCRAHDRCNITIPAKSSNYGLSNNGSFTRSHCSCDEEFHHCLGEANNILATKIGTTYFNILRPQCFAEGPPIVKCLKRSSNRAFDNKCLDYEQDKTAQDIYQWFDNEDFILAV